MAAPGRQCHKLSVRLREKRNAEGRGRGRGHTNSLKTMVEKKREEREETKSARSVVDGAALSDRCLSEGTGRRATGNTHSNTDSRTARNVEISQK